MLKAVKISKQIGSRTILRDCSLELRPGKFTAVVGPNGAGKTSLLRILSGEDKDYNGTIEINGASIRRMPVSTLSRMRAVLPQQTNINFPFTTEQIVEIGRHAHKCSSTENIAVINRAMEHTDTTRFKGRLYSSLSGGEQQRVQMARVIAQITTNESANRYMMLDEPTASLDIAQQHLLLSLARQMCNEKIGVLAILHDLNLAIQYADDILLLRNGHSIGYGQVDEVISEDIIEETFGHPVKMIMNDGLPLIIPRTCIFNDTGVCLNGSMVRKDERELHGTINLK